MQEDVLHYIWKYKKFTTNHLKTVDGEALHIVQLGQHNHNAGPDFFNAQLRLAGQLWAGNIEIHIKSSDWYAHNHEKDKAYDNVILHVVWEHDADIYRNDNSIIPTLVLSSYADSTFLKNYKALIKSKSWINCESDFGDVDTFVIDHWIERLYFNRLERKSTFITKLLQSSNNDWEAVLFKMLAKNFGLKVNGDAFFSMANSFNFSILRKLQTNVLDIEALFFGQFNLLNDDHEEPYYIELQNRFQFIKQKFLLQNQGVQALQFFRLRPANFPTIRLAQLASLYALKGHLFSKSIQLKTKEDFYSLFAINTTDFWVNHYTFSSQSKPSQKTLSKPFVELIIINTILPLLFSYAKSIGKQIEEDILNLLVSLRLERNTVTDKFLSLRAFPNSALTSQALMELKTEYCSKNKCLHCAVGNSLIAKNK